MSNFYLYSHRRYRELKYAVSCLEKSMYSRALVFSNCPTFVVPLWRRGIGKNWIRKYRKSLIFAVCHDRHSQHVQRTSAFSVAPLWRFLFVAQHKVYVCWMWDSGAHRTTQHLFGRQRWCHYWDSIVAVGQHNGEGVSHTYDVSHSIQVARSQNSWVSSSFQPPMIHWYWHPRHCFVYKSFKGFLSAGVDKVIISCGAKWCALLLTPHKWPWVILTDSQATDSAVSPV